MKTLYLIGRSRKRDYLEITHENGEYRAFIAIAGVGGEFITKNIECLTAWVKTRTQLMGGGQAKLTLKSGNDILAV